jgi:phosphoribosylpyrophosphate synthetase
MGLAATPLFRSSTFCEDESIKSKKLAFSHSSSFRSRKKKKEKTSANLFVISGSCHPTLAREVCDILAVKPHGAQISRHADGEVKMELDSVRGGNIFIIQPCGKPVSDSSMELLLTISAAKRAGAKKVTVVIPYFPYKHHRRGMPKSSKHKSKFLESTAMDFAKMLEEMGTDAVLTVDLQRPGQGQEACFFDNSIPLENIVTTNLISEYFIDTFPMKGKIVVIAPNYECLNKAMKYEKKFREGYSNVTVSLNALIHNGVSAHKQSTNLEELGKLEVRGVTATTAAFSFLLLGFAN